MGYFPNRKTLHEFWQGNCINCEYCDNCAVLQLHKKWKRPDEHEQRVLDALIGHRGRANGPCRVYKKES